MSKTWYPVIDYEKCIECGACTEKCKHGVYNQKKLLFLLLYCLKTVFKDVMDVEIFAHRERFSMLVITSKEVKIAGAHVVMIVEDVANE